MSRSRAILVASAVLATVVLAVIPMPAFAQWPYDWKLSCSRTAGAGARWNWTLNGQLIPGAGGAAGCSYGATSSGTGDRPAIANGFTASLEVCADFGKCSSSWGTWTFGTTSHFKANLRATDDAGSACQQFRPQTCIKATAMFAVSS